MNSLTAGTILTASEICQIIVACKENGVVRLKVGDLKVVFGSKPIDLENSASEQPKPGETVSDTADLVPIHISENQIDKDLEKERDDIADLLISDPLEYERALAAGELVDVDKGEVDRRSE